MYSAGNDSSMLSCKIANYRERLHENESTHFPAGSAYDPIPPACLLSVSKKFKVLIRMADESS